MSRAFEQDSKGLSYDEKQCAEQKGNISGDGSHNSFWKGVMGVPWGSSG